MAHQVQNANGWMPYLIERPPQGVLCRFRLEGAWSTEWTGYTHHAALNSIMGVPYLWWKLTGIARMEMEGQ